MSNAEITGLRPDIVVEMMTSSIPYDVTELEPKGTQSAAPNAMTNTANTISQGYDFFSSRYEKMMAGSGTQHFMTWLIERPRYTSDALFVMIFVTKTSDSTIRLSLCSVNWRTLMVRVVGASIMRTLAPRKDATMFHIVKKMGKVKPAPSKFSSSGVKAHLLKKFRPRLRASHVMVTKASTIRLRPMSKSVSTGGASMVH
mmetsp:Transcript_27728/g.66022  ORF Transcript_27728/g.66022 Transcript_27728/m.66022 type:complete len:200 (+) Transcript_27728:397-996(+)